MQYSKSLLVIYFIYSTVYTSIQSSNLSLPPFPPGTHKFIFYICNFHRIRTKKFIICMETQKTINSQSNSEEKKWKWRNQASWLQTILQKYRNQNSMALTQTRNIDQWNRIESSEINPYTVVTQSIPLFCNWPSFLQHLSPLFHPLQSIRDYDIPLLKILQNLPIALMIKFKL